MPFVNTMPTYKTVEITTQHKVGVHFVCPNCGKDSGWLDREIAATAEYTGHEDTAEKLAYEKAENDLTELLKSMNADNMDQIMQEPLKCPHCGALQLAGKQEQTVSKKGCLPFAIVGILLVIALAVYVFGSFLPKDQNTVIYASVGTLVLGIGLIVWYVLDMKRRNRLALESPQAELKYLGAVHNNAIEVDFRKRGPGGVVLMESAPEEEEEEYDL